MTAIGVLWLLIVLTACAVVVIGAAGDRWFRWTDQPWWWAVAICAFAVGVGRFLGQGDWWIAAWLALLCCAAGFNLRKTIVARRKTPTRTRENWERL